MDTFPNFPDMWRGLVSRVAELERQTLGPWQALTLINGFANTGAPYAPAAFSTDRLGRVYLRGVIQRGEDQASATFISAFVLPFGARPPFELELGSARRIQVNGTAAFLVAGGGAVKRHYLDDISFRVT